MYYIIEFAFKNASKFQNILKNNISNSQKIEIFNFRNKKSNSFLLLTLKKII